MEEHAQTQAAAFTSLGISLVGVITLIVQSIRDNKREYNRLANERQLAKDKLDADREKLQLETEVTILKARSEDCLKGHEEVVLELKDCQKQHRESSSEQSKLWSAIATINSVLPPTTPVTGTKLSATAPTTITVTPGPTPEPKE